MLTAKNINQYYGGSHILRNLSIETHVGKVTVLLGRNGVGKTTLLKSLMGLIPIKTGNIEFDGKALKSANTNTTPYERARAGIGYVPQGREIFSRLTVEANLRTGLVYNSASRPMIETRRATECSMRFLLERRPLPRGLHSTPMVSFPSKCLRGRSLSFSHFLVSAFVDEAAF